jgi:hypothetical protein
LLVGSVNTRILLTVALRVECDGVVDDCSDSSQRSRPANPCCRGADT